MRNPINELNEVTRYRLTNRKTIFYPLEAKDIQKSRSILETILSSTVIKGKIPN